mgnify:CR=1 FL=1
MPRSPPTHGIIQTTQNPDAPHPTAAGQESLGLATCGGLIPKVIYPLQNRAFYAYGFTLILAGHQAVLSSLGRHSLARIVKLPALSCLKLASHRHINSGLSHRWTVCLADCLGLSPA